jgi:hypothetical protein
MRKYCQFLLLFVLVAASVIALASDLLRVELKNRSAASLKSVLSELVEDDVKIISDSNSLILIGEMSALLQLKKIIIDLDVVNVSLSVSIYRGVDPNILKASKGIKKWGTNKVSNRIDSVVVENGQRLLINESELLVVPIESFAPHFNDKNETITIARSLFVEPSLLFTEKQKNKLATENQLTEKVFIRYRVPISLNNDYKDMQQNNVLSLQTHITSQRIIHTDEWLQLSGHKIVSYRPSLRASKKVFSTKKKIDSDNNIWIKINRLD